MRLTVPSFCRGALLLAGLTTAVSLPAAVRAADPQSYEVTLKPTGNSALDGALHDSSRLISLRESAPVGGFALVERARQDVGRFETALHSYGYYKAQVTVTVDGHPLTDPTLPATIEQAPAKPPMPVEASFDLGPQFHLGKITIQGAVPPDARAAIGLKQGDPAMAADVLAARDKLLHALQENSYPLAKVDLPPATLQLNRNELDVTLKVDTGPQADIGPIAITGLKDTNESFVRKRLLVHPGEKFSPSAIEKARADLASIGIFSAVRVQEPDHLDPNGTLPLTFDVTERPLHAVDLGIAYSTDLGVNFSAGWHDRNLFGNAEQLNLTAAMQLGGNALTKPGYQFGAQFIKPDFLARDQSLEIDLNAVKQSLQAYDQRALMEKIAINRRLSQHWTGTIGIAGVQEDITQQGVTRRYNLIGLPVGVRYDSTNSIFDPTQGARAAITVTPTAAVGVNSANFVIMQASGSTYFDFGTQGRSVLALRGMVGKVSGANVFDLPPDQRFYAGGSATVRGYRYQSLGPQFPDHDPTGGTAMSAGTIEFRQRIIGNFGAAVFVDAGQVTSNGAPFTSNWRVGTGVGARYYTPIGPIRLDVAVPLNKEPGGDSFELYIGIGQAF